MSQILHVRVVVAIAASVAWPAASAEWQVIQDSSVVQFTATQQGARFSGAFAEFDAEIDFDPNDPTTGRIVGIVQTESVNTRDYDRDAALTEPDWFDTSRYPEARFESESIEQANDGDYVANGLLTLKGKTRPMTLRFAFENDGSATAQLIGSMAINRFDYDVGEGWNDTSWIGQDVAVEVDLSLKQ